MKEIDMNTSPGLGVKKNPIGNYRWIMLTSIWLLYVINYFDRIAVLTLLPLIRADLSLTHQQIGLAGSIFFFAYAFAQISAGGLTDRFGAKKIMGIAIVVFTCFTFFTGMIKDFTQFLIVRLGLAFGEGHHYVPAQRCIAEWFPKAEKGRASAAFASIYNIAPAIIPVVVALLATWLGSWRTVFYVLAIPGVIGILVLWYYVSNSPDEMYKKGRVSKEELDHINAGLVTEDRTWSTREAVKFLLKDRSFIVYSLIGFCGTGAYWGSTTWLSSFLMEQHGFNIKEMGVIAGVPYLLGLLSTFIGGYLVDKHYKGSVKPVLWMCFIPAAILYFSVAQVAKGDVTLLIIILALMGFFVSLYSGGQYVYAILRYPKEVVGCAVGLSNFVWQMGAFFAPVVAGFLVTKTDVGFSYTGAFALFGGMCLCGALLVFWLDESHLKKAS